MAIKDYYPASRPTLDLNFAGSRIVDPRITFSRSGTGNVAGYFDEKGVMNFAPQNVPRIDFDPVTGECKGLLIEEQKTNLLTYSEQFDNTSWTKGGGPTYPITILQNTIVAPDGSLTADKLVERPDDASATTHFIYKLYAPSSGAVTLSIFAKAGERSIFRLGGYEGAITSTPLSAVFDLTEGTVKRTSGLTTSASITFVGNGWYRCVVSGVSGGNLTSWSFNNSVAVESDVYVGDGTSGIYVWGAQLEQGAFPTSYIPTTSAQVTRAADSASLTGANFSSWYKQDEGTLLAEWATTTASTSYNMGVFSVSDGTPNERIQIRRNTSPSLVSFIALDGGIVQYGDINLPFNGNAKSALAYKTNDFIGASNGALGVADTSGTLPSVSQADIGYGPGISQLNGHIKRIAYYPERLSNINLQALTA